MCASHLRTRPDPCSACLHSYPSASFATFADALVTYRSSIGGLNDCTSCAIAAAGPVDGNFVKLTNNSWSITCAEISTMLGGIPVSLINDLETDAAALPHLTDADVNPLGGPRVRRPELLTMLAV